MFEFEDAYIHPDEELKRMLEGKVTIHKSLPVQGGGDGGDAIGEAVADEVPLTVYGQDERPNTGLPDDFIDLTMNGVTRAMGANPLGLFRGYIALGVYCKTKSNGSVKRNKVDNIISQVWRLVEGRKSGNYMFHLNPQNVITPTSISVTTGYSVTALNVEWRADAEKLKAAAG